MNERMGLNLTTKYVSTITKTPSSFPKEEKTKKPKKKKKSIHDIDS